MGPGEGSRTSNGRLRVSGEWRTTHPKRYYIRAEGLLGVGVGLPVELAVIGEVAQDVSAG